MANTMTRSSTQAVGRGIGMKTIKETNKVMREHRTGYYKRRRDDQQHQSLNNIPISSDMTYGRLGQYEGNWNVTTRKIIYNIIYNTLYNFFFVSVEFIWNVYMHTFCFLIAFNWIVNC